VRRPEGFDSAARAKPPAQSGIRKKRTVEKKPIDNKQADKNPPLSDATGAPRQQRRPEPAVPSAGEHRAELRRIARERRDYERGEVRRFTKRARRRRFTLVGAVAVVVVLVGVLAVAIYSPILALRTIQVDGTTLVDAAAVRAAVDVQRGTPLALLDFALIEKQLATFPLIRSYVTETVPPSTLRIHVVEREPVASLAVGAQFTLIDPAGVVLAESTTRPASVPLIQLVDQSADSAGFRAVVRVLLALPKATLAQVDSITASTQDNVTLTLRGVGQRVVWGSADRSAFKSRVLIAMLGTLDPGALFEVDVSAPESVVVKMG